MFPRIFKIKKANKTYQYLKLVKNEWENGKVVQKVVANFGNIYKFKSKLPKLLKALAKYSDENLFLLKDLSLERCFQYGNVLVGKVLFKKVGLDKIILKLLKGHKIKFDLLEHIKAMVINRVCDPTSKYGIILRWLKIVYLPNWEIFDKKESDKTKVDRFYRAMDFLITHKEEIEKELYFNLKDLFSLKVDLVFYDITSTYFESSKSEIANYGYSRDERPNNKQILLGLVMVSGLPIACYVFEGNRSDKSTFKEILDDIEKRFEIKRVVFVLDRGMISEENISYLEYKRYQYIISLRRRNCREMKYVVRKAKDWLKIDEDLTACEIKNNSKRLIMCHNRERAQIEKIKREQIIKQLSKELERLKQNVDKGKTKDEKKITKIAEKILMKKHGYRYFNYEIKDKRFNYWQDDKKISYEEEIDGKYLLETNVKDLTLREVIFAYKELNKVEAAFREIKDFIKIRPIFHSNDKRIKAHVFICSLSFLLECMLEREMKKLKVPITARRALEMLEEIEMIKADIEGMKLKYITTDISPHARAILKVLKIKIPKVLN